MCLSPGDYRVVGDTPEYIFTGIVFILINALNHVFRGQFDNDSVCV